MLVGCLYVPNGNPAPGAKWDYKLRRLDRLTRYAAKLLELDAPVVLAGDYNIIPTDLDVYKPERWTGDALFRPEVKDEFHRLVDQGWTDALRELHPDEKIFTFWDYFRNACDTVAGLRLDHLLISPELRGHLRSAEVHRYVRGWVSE